MNDPNHKDVLTEVIADVLEKQAFLFAEPLEAYDVEIPENVPYLKAAMKFKGESMRGRLTLVMPESCCRELAVNMLGVDEDFFGAENGAGARDAAKDALSELLNVVCGSIITETAGEEPVFDLTVPQVEDTDPREWERLLTLPHSAILAVDELPLLLNLDLENGPR